MKKIFLIFTLAILIFFGLALWQLHNHTSSLNYTIINSQNDFEVRKYPPQLIAQAEIIGTQSIAINNGFAVLSAYLAGNNQKRMQIPLTPPVTMQKNGKEWLVTFFLPNTLTIAAAPRANAEHVHIKQLPATKYIVLQFSGLNTNKRLDKQIQLLKDYIALHNIKTRGEPIVAFYNSPWTLPFLRHNEIMMVMQ